MAEHDVEARLPNNQAPKEQSIGVRVMSHAFLRIFYANANTIHIPAGRRGNGLD